MHCRVLFSSSWWSEQINNVDFFDWDYDWFWKVTTFACSTIFKFFLTAFLYSRIVSAKWTFLSIALFCKIQLSQNVETHFRSTIKNFSTNIVSKSKKFLMLKVRMRFLRFFSQLFKFRLDSWMTIASMLEISRAIVSLFDRRFSCI
jgi:hypothetical protein